jgi:signal transduction histidine kinase
MPSEGSDAGLPETGQARLWSLLNRPRPMDGRVVAVGCGLLAIVYGLMAVLRGDPAHPAFTWDRGALAVYGLLGVLLSSRLTFPRLRAYTVGLAFVVSLGGGYVAAVLGNHPTQLPLTGLCTFVAVAFLQTGRDLVRVVPALAVAHAALLVAWPPVHVGMTSVVVMIGSSLLCGAATAVIIVGYSARLNESMRWWRDACERERAALRAKSEFLSTMSHELRSPLHVITGYAEMIADDADPATRALAYRIHDSALDLLVLVENTMNAARLEAGKLQVHLETFEPAFVLREIAENLAALPEAKRGVPVRWEVAPGLGVVRLDRLKLKEIVQNLVSNALKFTREGAITVDARADGAGLRIAVRDTGPGISAEAQTRIFDMFERVESGGAHRPPGVGLGLYIVRSLVGLLGGTIAVESTPGLGTCFTVWLPAAGPRLADAA